MSNQMNREREHSYRSALVLNNIGVDLLERRAYQQALVTLMDATSAMKFTLRRSSRGVDDSSGEAQHGSENVLDVNVMLTRAYRRQSRPMPMERQASLRIMNLSDDHIRQIPNGMEQEDTFTESIYPVRIEDIALNLRVPGSLADSVDVQAAIILHNLGLANLCIAHLNLHAASDSPHLRQAISLFQLSNSILEKYSTEFDDELSLRHSVCVNLAVVSGLMRALSTEHNTLGYLLFRGRLQSLRSAIQLLDEALPECIFVIHTAAAA